MAKPQAIYGRQTWPALNELDKVPVFRIATVAPSHWLIHDRQLVPPNAWSLGLALETWDGCAERMHLNSQG